jgi:apolipoprotein N-acyltransferase
MYPQEVSQPGEAVVVETSITYQSQSAEFKLLSQHLYINSWSYPSNVSGLVGVGLSLASIPLVYLLTISYPDTLPGPTWITALIAYMPFIAASLLYRNSLIQIYVLTFVVIVSIWLMYPAAVEVPVYFGIPFGVGFYLLTACSLHLWSVCLNSSELVGMDWIIRYSCMFMITAYTTSMVYGNLVSHAIQFFRAPFILQPISVFGFGSFEFLVILTNACLAWWIYASITTRKIFPVNFRPVQGETRLRAARRIVSNPLIFLTIVWIIWIIVAGIIKAAHTTDVRNKVQVATVSIGSYGESRQTAVQLGQAIAYKAKTTKAKFIVTPEFSLYVNEINGGFGYSDTCESLILNYLYPEIKGLGVYAVVGCFRISLRKPPKGQRSCTTDNLAYTLSPEGQIIDVYGKLQPTPGEESCYQPGVSVQTAPTEITGTPFKFSSLICYDMDFMGPAAKAADLGASLILNPANDWTGVRHHYAVLVIRAIENRVAIVKAERSIDPAIVDPFGNIIALGKRGSRSSASLSGSVQLTTPLKISWVRQQMPYWICILVYAVYLGLDIFRLYKRKFQKA